MRALEAMSLATLGFVLTGLILAFVGATQLLCSVSPTDDGRWLGLARLSRALAERRSMTAVGVGAVAYGLVFGLISSTIVFQPGVVFSKTYGVQVPSLAPVVCCGSFGEMPQFVVYVTDNFALLIVPLNVALLFTVSWLVGLNAAVVYTTYIQRRVTTRAKWLGGLGGFLGLFTVCPSCAGYFLLTVIGLSSGASVALTLASLQGVFVLAGVPILVTALLLNTRQFAATCGIEKNSGD